MRLVVGLGNPGERYAATRHNVAWRVLDELTARWHATPQASAPGSYVAKQGRCGEQDMVLLLPQTFMNRSGEGVGRWIHDSGATVEDLLVVSDDVYLPLGSLRLRTRGSSGGHRGLESIESELGHRAFARLRVGVGSAESATGLAEHVLDAFGSEEEPQVREAVQRAADAVECWAKEGIEAAMNRFNRRIRKEVSEP